MKIVEMQVPSELAKTYKNASNYRGNARCKVFRNHDLSLTTEKNSYFDAAVAEYEVIRLFYEGKITIADITKDLLSQGIDDKWKISDATRDVFRYITSLERKGEKPVLLTTKYFVVDGRKIKISPQLAFIRDKEIEVVTVRSGKPSITQTGSSRDTGVNQCIPLWLGVIYARSLVKPGESKVVKSSYHFLRKKSDRGGFAPQYDDDFFDGKGGGNVLTLNGGLCIDGCLENELVDKPFFDQLNVFDQGIDKDNVTANECDRCPNKTACTYQKTPVPCEKINLEEKKKAIAFSEAQENIIGFRKGYARVTAKAGSGKTACLTERVARMLAEGESPKSILCMTYTEAATQEMAERIVTAAETKNIFISTSDLNCMTFHAFGFKVIMDNYKLIGFSHCPSLIDTNDVYKKRMINNALEEVDFYTYANHFDALDWGVKAFDLIKSNEIDTSDPDAVDKLLHLMGNNFISYQDYTKLITAYDIYNDALKRNSYITYADIEHLMNKVLKENPEYLESLGYSHILIDEMQDSNDIQLETIKLLTSTSCFKSCMVVGDPNQSIYRFRNTSKEVITNIWEKLGIDGTDFELLENRRSVAPILTLADDYIELNKNDENSRMIPTRGEGLVPRARAFWSNDEEIDFVINEIKNAYANGTNYEDIAIMAFKRSELIKFAAQLSKEGIPYINKYPMPLCENSRVQAAVSLGMAFYQPDAEDLYFNYVICLNDGDIFNDMSDAKIFEQINELKDEFSQMDFREIPYQRALFHRRLDALRGTDEIYNAFLDLLYENEDLQSELEFIRDFKKFGESLAVKLRNDYSGVVLTTTHSSKGLEWPVCFLSLNGFDNEFLHAGKNNEEVEERRRLLYVAMTRARDVLTITGTYKAYGKKGDYTYNQFLAEVYKTLEMDYDPTGAEQMYYAKKEAEKKASGKSTNTKPATLRKRKVSDGEMTPEEIKEYENLVKGAQQTSFSA